MPAFFRDSLVQYVARTYLFSRDNSDGTKSQAAAAGGWLAIRSGLIPSLADQNPFAHWRRPMDMIIQGRSRSVFQA